VPGPQITNANTNNSKEIISQKSQEKAPKIVNKKTDSFKGPQITSANTNISKEIILEKSQENSEIINKKTDSFKGPQIQIRFLEESLSETDNKNNYSNNFNKDPQIQDQRSNSSDQKKSDNDQRLIVIAPKGGQIFTVPKGEEPDSSSSRGSSDSEKAKNPRKKNNAVSKQGEPSVIFK
jgi:hypothetical protein